MFFCLYNPLFLSFPLQRDSPDDSMKTGAGMMQDKRMDMGSMGDFNGVMGKNPGSRHQLHKESAMDRSPYYDKVWRKHPGILWGRGKDKGHRNTSWEYSKCVKMFHQAEIQAVGCTGT